MDEQAIASYEGLKIGESPQQDRPRERLQRVGAENLRLAELLAILIRSGRPGESAVQAGERIASQFADSLERLPDAARGEMKLISPAVAETAFCQIMAGIELGRRVAAAQNNKLLRRKITGVADAKSFCEEKFARLVADGKPRGVSYRLS